MKTTKNVLMARICPASYGAVYDQIYDKNNKDHVGQETYKDERTGKTYVRNQVHWIIKKDRRVKEMCLQLSLTYW